MLKTVKTSTSRKTVSDSEISEDDVVYVESDNSPTARHLEVSKTI